MHIACPRDGGTPEDLAHSLHRGTIRVRVVFELQVLADERAAATDLVQQHRDFCLCSKRERDSASAGLLKLCDRPRSRLANGDVQHPVRQLIRNCAQSLEDVERNRADGIRIERAAPELDEGNPLLLGARTSANGCEPVSHRPRAHGRAARDPAG